MINIDELKKFIEEANAAGYENDNPENQIKEKDGSTTLWYESGDWSFHDNFFGGEPYGGRIIVSYKKKPAWMMVYYGWLDDNISDVNGAYSFLRKALRAGKVEDFRGPKEFNEGKFKYINNREGEYKNYLGKEEIYLNGDSVYTATYLGGLVDQREGD